MTRSTIAVRVVSIAAALGLAAVTGAEPQMTRASRIRVTSTAASLVEQGVAAIAPSTATDFTDVPAPGIRFVANESQATTSPWIDSNGWRFQRGVKKARYGTLPPGSASLAAAEAFTYDIDAILDPNPADIEELGAMLRFLADAAQPALPVTANLGMVDDGSRRMGEILNLLTRRNLLYRVVQGPDRALDLTVQLGSADFPADSAANPHEFAARVRAKLGDDKRLVRLYGTSTVVAHLTGDATRVRLYLLSYGGRNRQQGGGPPPTIRVRVLGRYEPAGVFLHGAAADAALVDVDHPGGATEFSVPPFTRLAIVDLKRM